MRGPEETSALVVVAAPVDGERLCAAADTLVLVALVLVTLVLKPVLLAAGVVEGGIERADSELALKAEDDDTTADEDDVTLGLTPLGAAPPTAISTTVEFGPAAF